MPLRSFDMTDQDIENALRPGTGKSFRFFPFHGNLHQSDGGCSLQQLPYECPDPSFEYTTECDILKAIVGMLVTDTLQTPANELTKTVSPYEPPHKSHPSRNRRGQAARPTPVPSLLDVQPFMPEPKFVNKLGTDLEALLATPFMQDPYPYTGPNMILPSYSSEPSDSVYCVNLKKKVSHALRHAWKYDPIRCSVKAAFHVGREMALRPHNGLTEKEYAWVTGRKLRTAKKGRRAALVDFEQARRQKGWMMKHVETDDALSINQELDKFYGSNGTKLRPIDDADNNFSDEGFCEPDIFTKTIVTLPEKSLMEEGVTPGGIFQDSGLVMDEKYADYSRAHSAPNTAKEPSGVESQWPSFDVAMAPLRFPKRNVRSLGLFGDQKEREWHGRQQGPHDLHSPGSWASAPETAQVTFVEGAEFISEDPQDMAESFTPQPVPRETSIGRNIVPTSSPTFTPVTEVQDANQHMDGTSDVGISGNPLPAEVLPPMESVRHAQEVSEPVQGTVGETSEAITQPSPLHGSDQDRMNIMPSECLIGPPVSIEDLRNREASTGEVRLVGMDRSQHFGRSAGNGKDSGSPAPTSHVTRELPRMDIDTNRHVHHGITTTAFSTPGTQRTRQIQQVQVESPATPATISINLTPEYNSDMDSDDASVGSLEVRVPDSPTKTAEMGPSALGHYVQDSQSQSNPAAHGSSTVSLAGSASDEVSLIPTQARPDPPEGHAGFSKGVELHQRETDAVFTLDPSKVSEVSEVSPTLSNTAPIPVTPANGNDSASFQPTTPFQLDTPTHPDFDNPGTPTPAPKASKVNTKSVMNVFRSPKLGSRSPERAEASPGIVVAPQTPMAGQQPGSPFGSRGLLFQQVKKSERGTKNVLNSLNLSAESAGGMTSERDSQEEDSEDELAGGGTADVSRPIFKGGKRVADTPPAMNSPTDLAPSGRRTVAQAVVVRNLRSREGNRGASAQGSPVEMSRVEEPRKKRQRRERKSARGQAQGLDGPGLS